FVRAVGLDSVKLRRPPDPISETAVASSSPLAVTATAPEEWIDDAGPTYASMSASAVISASAPAPVPEKRKPTEITLILPFALFARRAFTVTCDEDVTSPSIVARTAPASVAVTLMDEAAPRAEKPPAKAVAFATLPALRVFASTSTAPVAAIETFGET